MHLFHAIKSLDLNEKQIEGIKSDIRIQLLRFNEEAKALLTPEQKTALKKKMEMTPMHGAMMGECPMMKGMDHSFRQGGSQNIRNPKFSD